MTGVQTCALPISGSLQARRTISVRNTLSYDGIDMSLLWRHTSSFKQEPLDVRDTGAAFVGNLPADIGAISGRPVNFGKVNAYNIFDLSTRFNIEKVTFTFTVQNLFDTQPPIVGNSIGSTTFNSGNTYPATYDTLGRRFAVGANVKF